MTTRDSTTTSAQSSGKIHNQVATCTLDIQDEIDSNFDAAIAIIDCVSVLTALERVGHQEEVKLALGDGYANGHVARNDSMPVALYHATVLLQRNRGLVEQVLSIHAKHRGAA